MQLPSSQCLHAAYIYGTVMGNEEIHNVALARSLSEEVNRFVRSLVANICKRTKERVRSLSPEGENCVPGFYLFFFSPDRSVQCRKGRRSEANDRVRLAVSESGDGRDEKWCMRRKGDTGRGEKGFNEVSLCLPLRSSTITAS